MSKANSSGAEQSMEDILASIRKIIAEDAPSSTAAPAPPLHPQQNAAAPITRVPMPNVTPGRQASLDDVLGMADDETPTLRAPAPAVQQPAPTAQQPRIALGAPPATAESGVPSWLFPKAPVAVMAPQAPADGADERSPPKPFFPPQTRDSAPLPKATPDLGSFVPGRTEQSANGVATPAQAANPEPAKQATQPAAPAAEAKVANPASAIPPQRLSPSLTERMNGVTVSPVRAPSPQPLPHQMAPQEVAKPAPSQPSSSPAPVASPQASVSPAAPAAAAATPIAVAPVASKNEPEKPAADVVPVATPATTAPARNVSSQPAAPVAAASVPVAVPSGPAATGAAPTMEDTVSELLRPMLRQWLDQNMPRVIEKALRSELAAGSNPKPGESKH